MGVKLLKTVLYHIIVCFLLELMHIRGGYGMMLVEVMFIPNLSHHQAPIFLDNFKNIYIRQYFRRRMEKRLALILGFGR